ncbi:RagB/SusD family nutrient uptake outer membrane protein [Parapedobacter sp. ISTM3]|uniref:RagB/SusD family nutrient uptake outer membrane protein n=1 Tax=Parapedobacter sp. ISTM3 TaxID=2800130 RepID=UPI001906D9D6|nr:RagB/SusD family nutrient uptake outer membrane protein [Parapedobacter sp. ISTM3]MBK1440541.1 RagB/SusD family nutrient uptake outer membrane protein [Parapedobacter sp. ISTM3]
MKRNLIYYTILTGALALTGCSKVLDKRNLSAVSDDLVWNDENYAEAFLNKLYLDNLPSWDVEVSSYSDEASPEVGNSAILYGQLVTTSIDEWYYDQIRSINLLMANVDKSSLGAEVKNSFKAQAAVLRAWRYFEMVRLYGGVPLVLHPQELTEDLSVSRASASDCIDAILADLEFAEAYLPWRWTGNDEGRFTKAVVQALKGRVLLYYASPQFNPNQDQDRWTASYNANKRAKEELAAEGYGLYESYANLWFDEMNKEVIFVKRFQEPTVVHSWDASTRPLSEAQNFSGANHPTWDMVASYPMASGAAIDDPDSGYDPIYYWKNRDPRFDATIAYNGVLWELSGKSGRRQWTYEGAEANAPTLSGFYCRKAVNVGYTPYFTERSSTDWIELRYAEVLLNFAESAVETGRLDEAYDVLKQIRHRAGIAPGSEQLYGLKAGMGKAELIAAIMLERKLEFAFEGKRYWDLRRRKLFEQELNGKRRKGLLPKLKVSNAEFERVKDQVDLNTQYHLYFEDEIINVDRVFDINFRDNYYFYALPNRHLETNANLEQTIGWEGGTFDPLK